MSSFMSNDFEEEDWQPPTEEELQLMRARQERSNRISKILGEYLLKGYRMLGTTCQTCDTILLRDRQQKDFCVACSEVDAIPDNKEAGTSNVASNVTSVESETAFQVNGHGSEAACSASSANQQFLPEPRLSPSGDHSRQSHTGASVPSPSLQDNAASSTPEGQRIPVLAPTTNLSRTKNVLEEKIRWATDELQRTTSVENSIQLCNLIKVSLETLNALSKQVTTTVQRL